LGLRYLLLNVNIVCCNEKTHSYAYAYVTNLNIITYLYKNILSIKKV